MPLYQYKCPKCGALKRRVVSEDLANKLPECAVCKEKMGRYSQPPSSLVKETLDNGFMSRKVERYADAERLFSERSKKHTEDVQKLREGSKTLV